jgi:twinkle protein
MEKLTLSEAHAQWLEDVRRIPCEIAAEMGVVSKGPNLAFEYRRNGLPVFIKVRREIAQDGETTKTFWVEPKGSALCLWNEDCLNEPSAAPLVITEGEFDALSFLASGATHVVSVPNGSPLEKPGEGDIKPNEDSAFRYLWDGNKLRAGLQSFSKIILATDDDHKGRVLRDELAIRLGRSRCWYVTYPNGCKDANEVLVAHGPDVLQDMLADAKPIVPNELVPFSVIPQRAHDAAYSTGWQHLDENFIVVPRQLIVVTGVPNAGKSQFVLAVVCNLARLYGLRGAILQLEDNPERNRADLIRYASGWRERNGIHEDPVAWVDRMFLTVAPNEDPDGAKDYDLAWLDRAIEEAATRHGCKWVVIDPWNEVEHLWGRQDTEATYLNRAIRHLRRVVSRYQITIFIVAHPTKEGGHGKKSWNDIDLYSVNGGAVWNNKADIGVVVWAEDTKKPERVVRICKSKDFARMGRPGAVTLRFQPADATYTFVARND